ncbi:MAG: site-specific DNA-methyltransferase, partial [Atopobiaceae bacterium]|nr:site-specific DNA-methyltransferase [Atopobiaceae bacterium]
VRDGSSRTRKYKTIWDEKGVNNQAGTQEVKGLLGGEYMSFPKARDLLEMVCQMGSDQNSIVLDFFSGSATTAHAIMSLNSRDAFGRKFIMVQLPEMLATDSKAHQAGFETICDLGKERIRRAGAKIAEEVEEANGQLRLGEEPKSIPDIGFRVLKLDESGIERPKPGELLLDVVKPDRSDEDIIFEMMLKWGLELTLPIEKVDAAGYPCYSVAYGELVCCLASGLNMQVLDAIADMEPRRVLMLDRNLDDTTKLNALQAFKRVEEKTGREVELRTV